MPLYEFECKDGHKFDRFLSVLEISELHTGKRIVSCVWCAKNARQIISKPFVKVFKGQILRDLCDKGPYVGSMRDVKDAINRYNDSELAAKQGRVALADQ